MDELIRQITEIRKLCDQYYDQFIQAYGDDNPRAACFVSISNDALMTHELLAFYHRRWSNPAGISPSDIKALRYENGKRCIAITKMLFIMAISSLEYNVRRIIIESPNHTLMDCVQRKEKLSILFKDIFQGLDVASQDALKGFKKTTARCSTI